METEEELRASIEKAQEENDEATLAMFQPFGKGTRQQAMNYRHYEQWLSCGYEGEPQFNEYGWLTNEVPDKDIEEVVLWGEDWHKAVVELAQVPNGKWVNGYNYMLSESGGCAGCSIWHTQYETRREALNAALDRIKRQIESGTNADKKHLADIRKAKQCAIELSLF